MRLRQSKNNKKNTLFLVKNLKINFLDQDFVQLISA